MLLDVVLVHSVEHELIVADLGISDQHEHHVVVGLVPRVQHTIVDLGLTA